MTTNKDLTIGLVGVCAAGKSTLRKRLQAHGVQVKHIAQEHSFVKDMWQRLVNPDVLVFLDASYETTLKRRNLNWKQADYDEQQRRLAHARQNADFYLHTDELSPEEVEAKVVAFLELYHRL
jgi:deoxyadenosine/deoxycytidine kinase